MNFQNPYSRTEYKKFFQDSLLTDNFRIIEEEIKPEFTPQFIGKAELIGRDKSLELEVYEVQHNSENDPRVGISKDFFRLMASFGSKRALAVFYSPKSKNYRLSLATVDLTLDGSKIKREYSNPRRYSFFLGPDAKVHTPYDFLIKKGRVKDFDDLQNRFSIEVVNKEFYKEIANWYFWALKKVKFPDDAEAEKNGREISVIRLITRLIFIWFMKVRNLVPEELFNENALNEILTDLKLNNDNYYKAILQNLFFATLNTKQGERRFTSKKKGYKGYSHDFGNHNVYRYEEFFKDSEEAIEKYFMPIPFLNGGLFECLDYKTKTRDERKYIDGFTSTKSQQPSVPNFLFFSDDKTLDLNKDYGTTNKKYNVRGLINTLSLYNFTIDESDPNDADVALDPELLGKVFENLLASYNPETAKTARKSTGSYYTPRPIVDYMVDESLKQYFKTHIQIDDIDNKLNFLFSGEAQSNPFDTANTKTLVNLIDSLRVVDPAVGSGAFPMRILNRLVFLLHKLDPDNSLWKQSQIDGIKKSVKDPTLQRKFIEETERKFKEKNPDYGRKLYLIEKCIYGVDIQQIAVEIAKLRFFISLLVDEKVENGEIEPLPNLDFKLMQGNSLISSFAGIDFSNKPQNNDSLFDFDEKYKLLIAEFDELKSQYQNEPDVKKKNELREKIDKKLLEVFEEKLKQHYPQLNELESKYSGRKEIIEAEKKKLFKKIGIDVDQAEQDLIAYTEGRKQKDFFLWDVYFAEVFTEKNGFDIVIGNPPYVQLQKEGGRLAKMFENEGYKTFERTGDIYSLFYEKGTELLKPQGNLCFITSNKWMRAGYGESTRKFFVENTNPVLLIDFAGQKIFEAATVDTNILLLAKEKNKEKTLACLVKEKELNNLSVFVRQQGTECNFSSKESWTILSSIEQSIKRKIEAVGTPLKDWDINIYRGILTGYNAAFIIDGSTKDKLIKEDKKSAEIIRPILRGRDIKRYGYDFADLWLINTHNGIKERGIKPVNINNYPAIKKHLDKFWDKIKPRADQGDTPYNLRNCAYMEDFSKQKIMYPDISERLSFCIVNNEVYCNNTVYFMVSETENLEYLLKFLNSNLIDWYYRTLSVQLGETAVRMFSIYVLNIPIPKNKTENIYNAYNLSKEEIKFIEAISCN
ncbi:MAG: hypothetical protein DAHOPDDO_01396 [Ignavibacteriaceae bacterium]|nr:hypothetical protein [Ignavibacteriaceae bacterium]